MQSDTLKQRRLSAIKATCNEELLIALGILRFRPHLKCTLQHSFSCRLASLVGKISLLCPMRVTLPVPTWLAPKVHGTVSCLGCLCGSVLLQETLVHYKVADGNLVMDVCRCDLDGTLLKELLETPKARSCRVAPFCHFMRRTCCS